MEKVLILNLGGDRARTLAARVRACSVYTEIKSGDTSAEEISAGGYKGIIISGRGDFSPEILSLEIPVFAVSHAATRLSCHLGGESADDNVENAVETMQLDNTCLLLSSLSSRTDCIMQHGEYITRVPTGFRITARTEKCAVAVMENGNMGLFAAAFSEDTFGSEAGNRILKNFLYKICGCHAEWTAAAFIRKTVKALEPTVTGHSVLCVLTGRENEEIAARLIEKAKQGTLSCLFINSGLLRQGEAERIEGEFGALCKGRFRSINAEERFLGKLIGITDSNTKNRICREEFARIAEEAIADMPPAAYYCDGAVEADERMKLTGEFIGVIEPLRNLYREELASISEALGAPKARGLAGPAFLADCIEGSAEKEKIALIKAADFIAEERLGARTKCTLSYDGKTIFIKTERAETRELRAVSERIKAETDASRVAYEL